MATGHVRSSENLQEPKAPAREIFSAPHADIGVHNKGLKLAWNWSLLQKSSYA